MTTRILALTSLLMAYVAPTADACSSSTSWHALRFTSVENATLAASEFVAESYRRDIEFAGAIVPMADHYRLTYKRNCSSTDTIQFEVPSSAVALWHTHGRMDEESRHYFSEADAEVVRTTGLPFYLLDRNSVQVLTPDDIHEPVPIRTARRTIRVHAYRGEQFALRTLAPATLPVRVLWFTPYRA